MAVSFASTTSTTSDDISILITGFDSSYSNPNGREIYVSINGSPYDVQHMLTGGTSYLYRKTGFTAGQSYPIAVYVYWYEGNQMMGPTKVDGPSYVTAGYGIYNPSIAKFYWNTNKVSGQAFNLTAVEWNALMNKINEVRARYSKTAISDAFATRGNNFTAYIYNRAVYGIAEIFGNTSSVNYGGYYISTHNTGDIVYASYLTNIQGVLNALIDHINNN